MRSVVAQKTSNMLPITTAIVTLNVKENISKNNFLDDSFLSKVVFLIPLKEYIRPKIGVPVSVRRRPPT